MTDTKKASPHTTISGASSFALASHSLLSHLSSSLTGCRLRVTITIVIRVLSLSSHHAKKSQRSMSSDAGESSTFTYFDDDEENLGSDIADPRYVKVLLEYHIFCVF